MKGLLRLRDLSTEKIQEIIDYAEKLIKDLRHFSLKIQLVLIIHLCLR